jgi:IS30 family transposase
MKLNNYDFTPKAMIKVISYLQDGKIPINLKTDSQINKFKNRWDEFKIEDDKVIYKKLNLEVVPPLEKEKKLEELYNDMKIGTGMGIKSFYNKVIQFYLNIKRKDVKEFLIKQYPYQLTKVPKKTINKPIISKFPNERWSCDLIDLSYYEGHNKKRKYILTVIDYFSKYVFAVGIVNKEPKTIIKAFEEINKNQSKNIYPIILQSDNGTEFKNEEFKTFCDNHNIRIVFNQTHSPTGNALVENFNKYLRKMINEGFVRTNSLNWFSHLKDYLYNRNHTKHRTTKFIPIDVWTPTREAINKESEIQNEVLNNLVSSAKNKLVRYKDEKLKVGDNVRILLSAIDTTLRKAIKQNNQKKIVVKFSPKVFTIKKIVYENQPLRKPKYYVDCDLLKKPFYYNELLKVDEDAETIPITPSELNKV